MMVVPSDVDISAVARLPSDIRAKLSADPGDFAVTRRGFRGPSLLIDEDTARLLELFRKPSLVIENVIAFATSRETDPASTLDEAYPLLLRLAAAKLLVPAGTRDADSVNSKILNGTEVLGFRVVRPWQTLDDSEVMLASTSSGDFASVKFVTGPGQVRALKREAVMMRHAAGRAPTVYGLQQIGGGLALVSEWINGLDAWQEASQRRRDSGSNLRLLTLCIETARAFGELHAAGLLHGDIHPANVIVEPGGRVRIIDYGLAYKLGGRSTMRGGVAFFMEPELARAHLANESAPLTDVGEQYSVGALLYGMWTGFHYVDWRLERTEMLSQVLERTPEPFEMRGVKPWPELESILSRAMSKEPAGRFASMQTLAGSLEALTSEAVSRDRRPPAIALERREGEELVARAVTRYQIGGPALRDGLTRPPYVSVTYGASGVAYALCRIAKRRMRADLLAAADVWVENGYAMSTASSAFFDDEVGITPKTVGGVSLFHSASGLDVVRGLVSIASGDMDAAVQAIQSFTRRCTEPCEHQDMTLGYASLLIGAAEIVDACVGVPSLDLTPLRSVAQRVAAATTALLHREQVTLSVDIPALGLAHGWAGLIFALLRWNSAIGTVPDDIVTRRLRDLWLLGEPHAGGLRWPVHNHSRGPGFMDGWCNGTAGHLMMNALALDVLKLPEAADLVELCARNVWSSRLRVGSLCCGLGGMSYALVTAYRVTGSRAWLDRARELARQAACDKNDALRDSLYKGELGVALLLDELEEPLKASMPLVQPSPLIP